MSPPILAAGAAFVGMGGALVDEKRIAAGDRAAIEAARTAGDRASRDASTCCAWASRCWNSTSFRRQPDGSQHYLEGHGGDTSNAAIAAARQGARVGYITALGRDMPGDSFMALWAREGVDATTVARTDRWLTGVYFVTHDAQGHHFLHYRANSAAAMYTPDDLPEAAIAAARMFYVSGISQGISDSACDAVSAAIDIARRNGVKIAYDTNYRPRLWPPARAAAVMHAAMAQSDYALPGIEDVQTLTGLTDPDAMLDFYLRLGPKVVVLKMGEAGAYLATPEQRVRIPRHVRCRWWMRQVPATRFAAASWRASLPATRRSRRHAMPTSRRRSNARAMAPLHQSRAPPMSMQCSMSGSKRRTIDNV